MRLYKEVDSGQGERPQLIRLFLSQKNPLRKAKKYILFIFFLENWIHKETHNAK